MAFPIESSSWLPGDFRSLLSDQDPTKWVEIVEQEDKIKNKDGEILATFFNVIVDEAQVQQIDGELLLHTKKILDQRVLDNSLSEKAQQIFSGAFVTYEKFVQSVSSTGKSKKSDETSTSFNLLQLPPQLLGYAIPQYLGTLKDIGTISSINKELRGLRPQFFAFNGAVANEIVMKFLGNFEKLPENLRTDIQAYGNTIDKIDLYRAKSLSVDDIRTIASLYPDLQEIQLPSTATDDLIEELKAFKKLKILGLFACSNLTGVTFHHLPSSLERPCCIITIL